MLLESAFREALSRADVVIATGGLGPTADDLTREAAAAAAGRAAAPRPRDRRGAARALRPLRPGDVRRRTRSRRTSSRGPRPCRTLAAPRPASSSSTRAGCSSCCPGPPGEMKPMFDEQVLPRLRARAGGDAGRAPPRPADRGDARERGGRDRRARLLALREPEDHDPRGGGAGRAAPRRARRRRRGGRLPHRGAGRGPARGPPRPDLRGGRPRPAAGGGGPPARARAHPRPRRVLHRGAPLARGSPTCPGRARCWSGPS